MLLFDNAQLTAFFASTNKKSTYAAYLIAIVAGLLLPLGFAPFEWRLFSIISPAILFILLAVVPRNKAFLVGYLYGFAAFGFGVSWIYNSLHEFGGAHSIIAFILTAGLIAAMALYFALMSWLSVRYLRHQTFSFLFMMVSLPIAWFLMEWCRAWFLTGFPWLLLGYSQVDTYIAGYIPVIGVMATSIPMCMISGGLAIVIIGREAQRLFGLGLAGFIFLIGVLLYPLEWTQSDGNNVNVAIVQGSVPQKVKMDPEKVNVSLDTYLHLTKTIEDTDIIVWPETAIPDFQLRQTPYIGVVRDVLKEKNASLITGIFYYDRVSKESYNSLMLIEAASEVNSQYYFKQRLVPFGEYLPLRNIINIFSGLVNMPIADLYPASEKQTALALQDFHIGASICYESAYSKIFRQQLPEAAFFINVSNDAWFGESFAPYQHLEMLRSRSIETGRYMVRSTNTGISAFITEEGQVLKTLGIKKVGILNQSIPILKGLTPYIKLPYTSIIIAILLLILVIYRGQKK